MSKVRVRYAPSPTGIPHIGNIRTALYNFLFAKSQKGDFILRIEDTDRKRLVPEALKAIKESLTILGLKWDEEEHQSTRLDIYNKHLEELKQKNLVYEEEGAWRFKIPKNKKISWKDIVHKNVEFESKVIEDFIIVKSDGFPTYHFASVVDDHDMQISHVMRGDEWISSTPKHIMLYQAFGWQHPQFVHLPPILGADHKKLSKREGAKSVMEYIEEGYLPEALVNFLAFLGWAPKDEREIFSLSDLINEFSLERINKNSPIFNAKKLDWFNMQWIKKLSDKDLAKRIKQIYDHDEAKIIEASAVVKDRLIKTTDFPQIAGLFFEEPDTKKHLKEIAVSKNVIKELIDGLGKLEDWSEERILEITNKIMVKNNLSKSQLYRSIGISISGKLITPPIFSSMELLGKETVINRLKKAYEQK